MAIVCYHYRMTPAEFWAMDSEETEALFQLLEEING